MKYERVIKYDNYCLKYYLTNYGVLFQVKSLIALVKRKIIHNTTMYQMSFHVNKSATVRLPALGPKAPICTGLKGLQQIFADRPKKDLEQIAIKLGIVEGDLPVTEDIKLIENIDNSIEDLKDDTLMVPPKKLDLHHYYSCDIKCYGLALRGLIEYTGEGKAETVKSVLFNLADIVKIAEINERHKISDINVERNYPGLFVTNRTKLYGGDPIEKAYGRHYCTLQFMDKLGLGKYDGIYCSLFESVMFLKDTKEDNVSDLLETIKELSQQNLQLRNDNERLTTENKNLSQQLQIQHRLYYN